MYFIVVFIAGLLLLGQDVAWAQQCAGSPSKTLVKASLINRYDVNTCENVNDYLAYVNQFLDTCSLSSVPAAATLGKCTRQCVTDSSCAAISYTSSDGCRACLDTTADGSSSAALSLDTTLIAAEKFKLFLDDLFSPCDSTPCGFSGTCVYESCSWSCVCGSGRTGPTCEELGACQQPSGLIANINDAALTESSMNSANYGFVHSRLNTNTGNGAWLSLFRTIGEYIEADLGAACIIEKVATQGRHTATQWVKLYKFAYSVTGSDYEYVLNDDSARIFTGNVDQNTVVENVFDDAFVARYVRVYPQTHNGSPFLRWEVYGCESVDVDDCASSPCQAVDTCTDYDHFYTCTGSGPCGGRFAYIADVPDSALTGSSQDSDYPFSYSRLNYQYRAWRSFVTTVGEYLQADLGVVRRIEKVATRGNYAERGNYWVTSYKFAYSATGSGYAFVLKDDNNQRIFAGNTDRNSVVENVFDDAFVARYVRVYPQTWYSSYMFLRWEVYGCNT